MYLSGSVSIMGFMGTSGVCISVLWVALSNPRSVSRSPSHQKVGHECVCRSLSSRPANEHDGALITEHFVLRPIRLAAAFPSSVVVPCVTQPRVQQRARALHLHGLGAQSIPFLITSCKPHALFPSVLFRGHSFSSNSFQRSASLRSSLCNGSALGAVLRSSIFGSEVLRSRFSWGCRQQ